MEEHLSEEQGVVGSIPTVGAQTALKIRQLK